jgi:hypothetical protein
MYHKNYENIENKVRDKSFGGKYTYFDGIL